MSGKKQQHGHHLSTAAKVGVGVAAAAAVMGAGFALAKFLTEEKEVAQRPVGEGRGVREELQRVVRSVEKDKKRAGERKLFVRNVVRLMVTEGLCEDPLFRKLYQDVLWTGSYYEGLKISAPDEFDLNVILRLPVKQSDLQVTSEGAPPAHVVIGNFRGALKSLEANNDPHWEVFRVMEGWCGEKGTLRTDKVGEWLGSLFEKHLEQHREKLLKEMGLTGLQLRRTGSAVTLVLDDLTIDLVPALEFQPPMLPPQPFRNVGNTPLPWYAVPRPGSGHDDHWRLSFCQHERSMIHGNQSLESAIRLIKKLRDNDPGLGGRLGNYLIKMTALWEIEEGAVSPNLEEVFLHLLRRLQFRLQTDSLPSYWDPRFSLLQGMGTVERENVANRLRRIISSFERSWTSNPALVAETIVGTREKCGKSEKRPPSPTPGNPSGSQDGDLKATE